MTGRYLFRFGLARAVISPWLPYGVPKSEITLGERLAKLGYESRGAFGKWHLGHLQPEWHPLNQGFTDFEGQYNGMAYYWTRHRVGEPDWHVADKPTEITGYTIDLVGSAVSEFIRNHAADDSPFFAYVPFTAPHLPLQALQELVTKYRSLANDSDELGRMSKPTLAAMIDSLDVNIGKILSPVDEAGIRENTAIWFFSDNGGIGAIPDNNAPLRGEKRTTWEGGIRVPAAVMWPGSIRGGRVLNQPVINTDLLPTLLAVAGHVSEKDEALDGLNIIDSLLDPDKKLPARKLFFYRGKGGPENEWGGVISESDWKLVVRGPDVRRKVRWQSKSHEVGLYNLKTDPNETTDLSSLYPDIVEELGGELVEFRRLQPANGIPATGGIMPDVYIPPKKWERHLKRLESLNDREGLGKALN
ncbi:sulfatase-like hydrolase/transferase [Aliiglaciecola sp. 3_MG-2023]|uniref:sulfatase-like hydrolase/transferase n=1 Tax=Aliiglaciecola sp. 3_MG-2023 TaxID=3062644 RepID=UPI0026E32CD4|nr:sulfatase-like hydrolase/transferase [Aliiglaciecola sp. 3_MG-2023]MDO6693899.1 sulfatase-like hydrolase/transferase [Aliiglaciecola sp. 3_MG-2023]